MDILSIGILGVIASLIIQGLKNWMNTSPTKTKLLTIGISLILGGAYFFWKDTSFWKTSLEILAIASTVYAFFISAIEGSTASK